MEKEVSRGPWIRSPDLPLDLNGPATVPYTRFDERRCDLPLIEVIGEIARRLPSQVAIDDGSLQLTYPQLYAMACRLSQAIGRAGLPPGPLGVKLPNDAFYLVAMLGCLAAGRPCLLLSPDSPADYNARLTAAGGLQGLVVTAAEARAGTAAGAPPLIPMESAVTGDAGGLEQPFGRLGADDPAFILSTSGSTGVPKLIVWPQAAVARRAICRIDAAHYSERDRILMTGAPATGAALSWRFIPLLVGATLHIIDVPRAGIGGLRRVLRDKRITSTRFTVSLLKAVMQDAEPAEFASLRVLWGGGEPLLQSDLRLIRRCLPPGCFFANSMNMTEGPVTQWFVPATDDHDPALVGTGYLVPGTEAMVVDDDGRPCPAGELGELIVRSANVAVGEWRAGRLAAGRFEIDPGDPAKRILRTGDMVRIHPDGLLVAHGRKDRMVKIRGHRVAPAIVEEAIRRLPEVADALVAVQQLEDGPRLCAFVVPRRPGPIADIVRGALRDALPDVMRPAEIRCIEALPTTSGGKVDVAALLAGLDDRQAAQAAPGGASASGVASAWARDLVDDAWRVAFRRGTDPSLSFDAAGGDSLKFMQLVFRLEQRARMALPLSAFDLAMTQADMARVLDDMASAPADPPRDGGGGSGKRIFLLPGAGGDEPRLLRFGSACAPDVSFVYLDYGDWTEWVAPDFAFASLVDRLLARIEDLAPSGPLCLAGYSLGGQVAFVLAARLRAAGRQIERLLILDCEALPVAGDARGAAPGRPPPSRRSEFAEWRAARRNGKGSFALARIATRRLLSPRWAPLLRWLARHRRSVLRGRLDFYLSFQLHTSLLVQLAAAWRRALSALPRLPVAVTVFRTGRHGDPLGDGGWRAFATQVTMVPVGGDHFTMFDPPHLADLCTRFKAACGEASDRVEPATVA